MSELTDEQLLGIYSAARKQGDGWFVEGLRAVADAAVQAARERQEPVGWQFLDTGHFRKKVPKDSRYPPAWRPVYTIPPAAPVPVGYVLVPQAWLVSLASVDFGHGEIWSDSAETAAAGMRAMLAKAPKC